MTLIVKYALIPFMLIIGMFFIGNCVAYIRWSFRHRFRPSGSGYEQKKCYQHKTKLVKDFCLLVVCVVIVSFQIKPVNVGQTIFIDNEIHDITEINVFMWESPLSPYTKSINNQNQIGYVMALLNQYNARKSLLKSHSSKVSTIMEGHVLRLWYTNEQDLRSSTIDVWSTGLISFGANGDVTK